VDRPALGRSSLSAGSDAALAEAAARGDRAAFAQLVRRHERKLRGFLRKLAGHDADDLAQETFVRAWRSAAAYRGEGSYEGWLLRIGWRLFLTARSRKRAEVEWSEAPEPVAEPGADLRIDIGRALAALPDRERAAALLCLGEGYSHGEAAEILEIPLGTLKSVVARARAALVASLQGEAA